MSGHKRVWAQSYMGTNVMEPIQSIQGRLALREKAIKTHDGKPLRTYSRSEENNDYKENMPKKKKKLTWRQ